MFVDNHDVPSVGCGRPSGIECSILSTCTLDVKKFKSKYNSSHNWGKIKNDNWDLQLPEVTDV